jgi:hypothetical protein
MRLFFFFQTAMIYDTVTGAFFDIHPGLWYWVKRNNPPPDKPSCGFRSDDCGSKGIGT